MIASVPTGRLEIAALVAAPDVTALVLNGPLGAENTTVPVALPAVTPLEVTAVAVEGHRGLACAEGLADEARVSGLARCVSVRLSIASVLGKPTPPHCDAIIW